MSAPRPDERVRERLEHLPDACRALLAAIERQGARGGGEVRVTLHVDAHGEVESVELVSRFARA